MYRPDCHNLQTKETFMISQQTKFKSIGEPEVHLLEDQKINFTKHPDRRRAKIGLNLVRIGPKWKWQKLKRKNERRVKSLPQIQINQLYAVIRLLACDARRLYTSLLIVLHEENFDRIAQLYFFIEKFIKIQGYF